MTPDLTYSNGPKCQVATSSGMVGLAVFNTDVIEYLGQAGSIPEGWDHGRFTVASAAATYPGRSQS